MTEEKKIVIAKDLSALDGGISSRKNLKYLNYVKKDPMIALRDYMENLIKADPKKGKQRAAAIWKKVGSVVTKSFGEKVLPVQGQITKSMQNERLDKCANLVLSLADEGWVSTRIIDELERIFFGQLKEGDAKIPKRSSWGVRETHEVEFNEMEVFSNEDGQ